MRGQATLTKDEAEKLVQSACAAMATELARLRAELEAEVSERDAARAEAHRLQTLIPGLRAELAQAERERDEALLNLSKQTEYAEILAEKAHNMEAQRDEALIDRKHLSAMLEMELKRGIRKERKLRKTIRTLVVAARAVVRVVYALAQSCFVSKEACINALRVQLMYAQQAENTAQFRAYLMGKNPGYLKQAERGQVGKE